MSKYVSHGSNYLEIGSSFIAYETQCAAADDAFVKV